MTAQRTHDSTGLAAEVRQARRLPSPAIARAIRDAAGVSQARMAAELGIHRVSLARYELGLRSPRGELRRRYVEVLDELREELAA